MACHNQLELNTPPRTRHIKYGYTPEVHLGCGGLLKIYKNYWHHCMHKSLGLFYLLVSFPNFLEGQLCSSPTQKCKTYMLYSLAHTPHLLSLCFLNLDIFTGTVSSLATSAVNIDFLNTYVQQQNTEHL